MRKNLRNLFVFGSFLLGASLYAQDKTVTGKVTDPDGFAVADASVKSSNGIEVFTDDKGMFSIQSAKGDVITIESEGLPLQTFVIGDNNNYTISIKPTADLTFGEQIQLNDVVVTALGIKKKSDALTNAQQIVGSKELNQASSPSAVQALVGKVSGLTITTTNNSVDSNYRIVLRGARSITSDNQALIVIDNVISSATVFKQLPPEAIENVNVIKGLQGSALYGDQGVNGVIIVTTKRGSKSEKLQVTFNSSVDVSQAYMFPKVQTKYGKGVQDESWSDIDYDGTNYVPWENMSWGPAYDNTKIAGTMMPSGLPQADGTYLYEEYSPIKNHMAKFFKNGITYQNGVTISAGGNDSYAFASINRVENNFVVIDDKLVQNSFLFKAGKKINKFRIDGNINYINKSLSQTNSSLYDDIIQMPTNNNIKTYRKSGIEGYLTGYAVNPYWTIDNERYDTKSDHFSGILSMEYEFNKNINVTYTGSIITRGVNSESHNNGQVFTRTYGPEAGDIEGYTFAQLGNGDIGSWYQTSTSKTRNFYGDLMLNFDYDLSSRINLKANIGNNIQDNRYNIKSLGGDNLRTPGWYHINNVLNPDPFYKLDNRQLNSRKISWFVNADLAFEDYLFLNGTYRIEQSSVLSKRDTRTNKLDNKPYHFYSAGLSFIPTKAFNIQSDFLSYSKIALGYTLVGNSSAIGAYEVDEIGVFPTGYPYGSLSSYIQTVSPTSVNIVHEKMSTLDLNVILGFFKNRINIEGAIYQTNTTDLITSSTTSSASGLASLKSNVGEMRLRGGEIDLNITAIKSTNFTWDIKAGYSTSVSKVIDLEEGADEIALLSYSTPSVGIFAVKGESFPMIKGTKFIRDDQGRVVVNANGNPMTTSTFEMLGKATPDYVLNFSTSVRYKSLRLAAVMDYRHGGKFISFTKNLLAFTGGLPESADFDRSKGYVIPNSVKNTGTAANPVYVENTTAVGNSADYNGVVNYFSSAAYRSVGENLLVDATAFKMREISLSYDLPSSLLGSSFVNSVTIGAYARNPFVIYAKDNKNYADPETSSSNGNAAGIALTTQYPSIRSFGFNLKATF